MPTSNTPDLPLLLDTHLWIWTMEKQASEVPPLVVQMIREASKHERLFISVISMWEVAMLAAKNRITLSSEPLTWIEIAVKGPGTRVIGITPRIAVDSTRLPGNPHGDPSDRILMATARDIGARLVTRDRQILSYAEREHSVAVLDARP